MFLIVLFVLANTLMGCSIGAYWYNGLDIVNHVAPLWLAGQIIACILLWIAVSNRTRLHGFLIFGVLLGSALIFYLRILPETAFVQDEPTNVAPASINLISFNASKDNSMPQKAADWMLRVDPDIIVLQEVVDDAFYLLTALKDKYPFHADCLDGDVVCPTVIVSKMAPEEVRSLATADPFDRKSLPAVYATYIVDDRKIGVVATHFSRPDVPWMKNSRNGTSKQKRDIRDLIEFVHSLKGDPIYENIIVAGDFNLTPWSITMKRLDSSLDQTRVTRFMPTWPVTKWEVPLLPIDHAYVGNGFENVRVSRGPNLGSDHLPFVLKLDHKSDPKAHRTN